MLIDTIAKSQKSIKLADVAIASPLHFILLS
jgi:hypothetical protein